VRSFRLHLLIAAAAAALLSLPAAGQTPGSVAANASDASPSPPPSPALPKLSPAAKEAAEAGLKAMGKNNFAEAETDFLKLLQLSPENVSALVNLGLVEFRLGRAEQAQGYLQRALRLKPDAALAWMTLGVIENNEGDLEAATAALAQAVYLNPKSPQSHNYFAVTLSKRGWYDAAEDEWMNCSAPSSSPRTLPRPISISRSPTSSAIRRPSNSPAAITRRPSTSALPPIPLSPQNSPPPRSRTPSPDAEPPASRQRVLALALALEPLRRPAR
jgi:tetratricopeptide (TPR) repeat protein